MKAIVLVQVFPNLLALIAIYLMIQQTGRILPALGLNSHLALILVYLGGVLGGNVWLMKGYMDGLPRELDESAAIDGAGQATIFWRILLPLTKPMLAVTGVLAFVASYSEILLARVLLTDNDQLTLALGLYTYARTLYATSWGAFAAGALIAAVPAVVLFYLLQNWLIKGLTAGSVKS
jgi:ABC-type maltose transport system permease subunit